MTLPKIILPAVFFNGVDPTLSALAPYRRNINNDYENKFMDHLQKNWSMIRIQGFKDSRTCTPLAYSSEMLKNYKELKVWQKSYQLCLEIYRITERFPKDEKFGLTSQIRRAEKKHLNL